MHARPQSLALGNPAAGGDHDRAARADASVQGRLIAIGHGTLGVAADGAILVSERRLAENDYLERIALG